MGHSSIKVTFDLYGHLMPGAEAEAAALLDTFLGAEMESGEESVRAVGAVHGDGGTGRTGWRTRASNRLNKPKNGYTQRPAKPFTPGSIPVGAFIVRPRYRSYGL